MVFFQERKKRTIVSVWENLLADLTMCQIHSQDRILKGANANSKETFRENYKGLTTLL